MRFSCNDKHDTSRNSGTVFFIYEPFIRSIVTPVLRSLLDSAQWLSEDVMCSTPCTSTQTERRVPWTNQELAWPGLVVPIIYRTATATCYRRIIDSSVRAISTPTCERFSDDEESPPNTTAYPDLRQRLLGSTFHGLMGRPTRPSVRLHSPTQQKRVETPWAQRQPDCPSRDSSDLKGMAARNARRLIPTSCIPHTHRHQERTSILHRPEDQQRQARARGWELGLQSHETGPWSYRNTSVAYTQSEIMDLSSRGISGGSRSYYSYAFFLTWTKWYNRFFNMKK